MLNVAKYPSTLLRGFGLESSYGCNARCAFCCLGHQEQKVTNVFTGETWTKKKKLMDWKLMEAILEKHKPGLIILTGQREPFLDPRIPDIMNLGSFAIAIFSNANMMTSKVLDKIMPEKRFISITFSLNAFSDATRLDIMGIPYEQAKANILMFLEKRRESGREVMFNAYSTAWDDRQDLRVGVSLVAIHGMYKGKLISNLHEIIPFKRYWEGILRQYHCNWEAGVFPAGNWGGAIPREVLNQEMKYICVNGCGQWDCTAPIIDVDGQIMLCCYNSRWSFGSCLDDEAVGRWQHRREIFGVQGPVLHASRFCEGCSHRFVPTRWDTAP